jgi:hypothetical protein
MKNAQIKEEHLTWLTKELQLIGLHDKEVGKKIISLLDEVYNETNGDLYFLKNFKVMVSRCFDKLPLSPLQGGEEMYLQQMTPHGPHYRNTRYPAVCMDPEINSKIYDDEAVVFLDEKEQEYFLYQGKTSSRKEISFPYYPEKEYVDMENTKLKVYKK